METLYSITENRDGYVMECRLGPCKSGHEHISTKDQQELLRALNTLRVPQLKIDAALRELRLRQHTTISFDAKVMEPIT